MIAGAEHCGPGGCKLRIAGVSKVFDGRRGKVVALEGINLNIRGGEFVCLVGASGCGKTSLLNIIAGLEFPSSGVVELDGEPVTGPGRDRTVMFQESALFPWLDVMGNVMFGLNLVPGLTRGDRLAMAEKNLEDNTFDFTTWEEVKEMAQGKGGFARTKWCGSLECELAMKEKAGVSSRCMPLKQSGTVGKCPVCGKECTTDIYWGVAY